jgi:hypothetical protein
MWTFQQSTGKLSHSDLGLVWTGYSGNGPWRNNPEAESIHGHGPIPRGRWLIGAPEDRPTTGRFSLSLTAGAGTKTLGRSGFYIHGEKRGAPPGNNSLGCLIFPRLIRWAIAGSGDRDLEVVP